MRSREPITQGVQMASEVGLSKSHPRHQGSAQDALCCCEYENVQGDRSHILAACCDCEALDNTCDRILKCEKIPDELLDRMCLTFSDRLRIPGFRGAIRLDSDIIVPAVSVPLFLTTATIGRYSMYLSLSILPAIILIQYRIWTRRKNKPRTRIFYLWGLFSTLLMFVLFCGIVYPMSSIPGWHMALFLTLYGIMMVALYHAKKDPGYVKYSAYCESVDLSGTDYNGDNSCHDSSQRGDDERDRKSNINRNQNGNEHSSGYQNGSNDLGQGDKNQSIGGSVTEKSEVNMSAMDVKSDPEIAAVTGNPVAGFLVAHFGFDKSTIMNAAARREEQERRREENITEEEVTWVDSRSIENGILRTWCRYCLIKKPPRSGHCPVCETCILGRDHHCVWINNCVGAYNLRSFMLAILIFVIGGFYGAYLTINTICPPVVVMETYAVQGSCSFPFPSYRVALAYVSAWYSCIACVGMSIVLLNQVVMVAQNITSQELHYATKRGWSRCLHFAYNNINNRGVIRNVFDFVRGRRRNEHSYGTMCA